MGVVARLEAQPLQVNPFLGDWVPSHPLKKRHTATWKLFNCLLEVSSYLLLRIEIKSDKRSCLQTVVLIPRGNDLSCSVTRCLLVILAFHLHPACKMPSVCDLCTHFPLPCTGGGGSVTTVQRGVLDRVVLASVLTFPATYLDLEERSTGTRLGRKSMGGSTRKAVCVDLPRTLAVAALSS